MMPAKLSILLFGPPIIRIESEVLKLDTRKAVGLLTYLAIKNQPVSRDTLCNLLWTDYEKRGAQSALRRTLSVLNKGLNQEWLVIQQNTISLKESPDLYVDVNSFRTLINTPECQHNSNGVCELCYQNLSKAVEIYHDDFLAGFGLRDGVNFDNWQQLETDTLERQLEETLRKLISWHQATQEYEKAIFYANRWLSLDPLNESSHYTLMQLYVLNRQRSAALKQYQICVEQLTTELGIEPLQETTDLFKAIQNDEFPLYTDALVLEDVTKQASPALSIKPTLTTLPHYNTAFIGRERELDEIHQLLQSPSCRLLTLTGPGGIGKTRLAIQAAAQCSEAYGGEVYFVALADISTPDKLIACISMMLGISFYEGLYGETQLLDYLRHKKILLVLDGFESCINYSGLIAKILNTASYLKLIITSQVSLNLQGEWLFQVQGMTLPSKTHDFIETAEANHLFFETAQRFQPNLKFNGCEAAVAEICYIVDGNPLALELAASLLSLMPCEEIAQEINRNLDLLQAPFRDVPTRHLSLKAVFEYAWNLLTPDEQKVLQRLAFFEGNFRRDAALQVANASTHQLKGLIEKSLLVTSEDKTYHIVGTIRRYAREKLAEQSSEEYQTAELHARYYANFLAQQNFSGLDYKSILQNILVDLSNILAGARWALSQHQWMMLDQYIENLYHFYDALSWFQDGFEFFSHVEKKLHFDERILGDEDLLFAKTLARKAVFSYHLGDYDLAIELLQESLSIFSQLSKLNEVAFVLNYLGIIYIVRGDYLRAKAYLQKSLEIYEELNQPFLIAKVSNNLGILANYENNYPIASDYLQKSLRIYKTSKNARYIAYTLNNLGNVALKTEKLSDAGLFFQESYRLKKEIGDQWGCACSLVNLGRIAERQGSYSFAYKNFRESLDISTQIGKRSGMMIALYHLGSVMLHLDNYQNAIRYFLKALNLAIESGIHTKVPDILVGIATLFLYEDKKQQAVYLLQMVVHDSKASNETKAEAEHLLSSSPSHMLSKKRLTNLDQAMKEIIAVEYQWHLSQV
ncbi:MAG: tetratricopeptide repeat protein [Chloroflexi bacterium]|nr:tetratricopeptide repeat protein [Chloroflexota bacterium]